MGGNQMSYNTCAKVSLDFAAGPAWSAISESLLGCWAA